MKESNLMNVRELAEYLRCHPATIYKLLKKGKIPAFKVGSDWRFNPEAIDEWRGALCSRPSGSATSSVDMPLKN
jgi:excisionase family DNA binding protein